LPPATIVAVVGCEGVEEIAAAVKVSDLDLEAATAVRSRPPPRSRRPLRDRLVVVVFAFESDVRPTDVSAVAAGCSLEVRAKKSRQ
jgi:hypothetical protein